MSQFWILIQDSQVVTDGLLTWTQRWNGEGTWRNWGICLVLLAERSSVGRTLATFQLHVDCHVEEGTVGLGGPSSAEGHVEEAGIPSQLSFKLPAIIPRVARSNNSQNYIWPWRSWSCLWRSAVEALIKAEVKDSCSLSLDIKGCEEIGVFTRN